MLNDKFWLEFRMIIDNTASSTLTTLYCPVSVSMALRIKA